MITARRAIRPVPAEPRVRRAYFDCRFGQLHTHYAIPGGGGFDEATPLLCVPGAPGSGRFFVPLLAALGRDRSVYAPDLPGCGESDPATGRINSADAALALCDFLDSMHLRSVDLLVQGDGAAVALALLDLRPAQIARLVLSPATETARSEARALRHATLVMDLLPPVPSGCEGVELERQIAQLREFLGPV